MSLTIAAIQSPQLVQPIQLPTAAGHTAGDFQGVLQAAIQQVEGARSTADHAVQNYLAGDKQELHSTILATQTAELQFDLFLQVRNKVVGAYQEIMKMQV